MNHPLDSRARWWIPWVVAAVIALLLGPVGVAWACVPQPLVIIEPAAFGASGSQVTVHGLLFGGDVEVRWNAIDGPKLATASGNEFSVPITIPQANPGMYTIIVVIRGPNGVVSVGGRASFLVPGQAAAVSARAAASSPTPQTGSSSGHPLAWALAADVGFLLVGGLGGALLVGRRRANTRRRQVLREAGSAD